MRAHNGALAVAVDGKLPVVALAPTATRPARGPQPAARSLLDLGPEATDIAAEVGMLPTRLPAQTQANLARLTNC